MSYIILENRTLCFWCSKPMQVSFKYKANNRNGKGYILCSHNCKYAIIAFFKKEEKTIRRQRMIGAVEEDYRKKLPPEPVCETYKKIILKKCSKEVRDIINNP